MGVWYRAAIADCGVTFGGCTGRCGALRVLVAVKGVKTPVGPYSELMGCGNVGRYKGLRLGL